MSARVVQANGNDDLGLHEIGLASGSWSSMNDNDPAYIANIIGNIANNGDLEEKSRIIKGMIGNN